MTNVARYRLGWYQADDASQGSAAAPEAVTGATSTRPPLATVVSVPCQ